MHSLIKSASLFILGFLLINPVSFATNYYLDSKLGSDSKNGRTPENAWMSLSKVSSSHFLPGDSILLKRGGEWRETLTISSSGTKAAYIHFSSYGTGPKPRILGSNTTSWTSHGANIWVSDETFLNPYGGGNTAEIFFVYRDKSTRWGVHQTSLELLTSENLWTWESARIYIFSPEDPNDRYLSVEIPQRPVIIEPNNKKYLRIRGFDLFYSLSEGVGDGSYPNLNLTGLIIEFCHIAYLGSRTAEIGYGTTAVYSDMVIRYDTIHDCGRRAISVNLYASGFTVRDILIEGNLLYNGFHTTGVDINIGTSIFTGSIDGITIRNNEIFDNQHSTANSELIFAQNYGRGGTLSNLFIYNNIFRFPSISAIKLENVQSTYIYNNTFYGHNLDKDGNTYHIFVDDGSTNIKIKNNIFYTTLGTDLHGSGLAIYVSASQDHRQIDADFNLYYRINNNLRTIIANGTDFYINSFQALNKQLGWELHSPAPSDPLFDSEIDLHLKKGSPAIGNGVRIEMIRTDFEGTYFNDPPSIGALEGDPSEVPRKSDKAMILFPNPTSGFVNLLRDSIYIDELTYRVFSISGKAVLEGSIDKGADSFYLHLNSGLYIIHIMNGIPVVFLQKVVIIN